MAEKRTRRRFTAEFKAQAVKRVLEGGKELTEVPLTPRMVLVASTAFTPGQSFRIAKQRASGQANTRRRTRQPCTPPKPDFVNTLVTFQINLTYNYLFL